VYDATKNKFRDVAFQSLNLDDQSSKGLANQYNVSSIPRVIFLDGNGNTLYNGTPASDEQGFSQQLSQFH
jgi:thioredoxin-related protein